MLIHDIDKSPELPTIDENYSKYDALVSPKRTRVLKTAALPQNGKIVFKFISSS